jgi:hypothetical protein
MSNFEWMKEGEQPLRQKSRGRLVHVSDFILEHCGRLALTPDEVEAQLSLPKEPLPPSSVPPLVLDPALFSETSATAPPSAKGKGKGKAKAKEPAAKPVQGRTYAENDWTPPPPPVPFSAYQIPVFDAHCIIYPGAKNDPWWDMPQLIAQVWHFILKNF